MDRSLFCEKGKPSIHCLGQPNLCQMGKEAVSRQDTRSAHHNKSISTIWDDYLTNTALAAMANGHEISMDQRADFGGEEYLGTPTFTQTLTIRTAHGHTAQIQTRVTQEHHLRRYVLSTPPPGNSTTSRGSTQSNTSTCAVFGSNNSSQCSPCLSF